MSKSQGFTIIELLLVTVVIVIIAVISIPQFMRSRLTAEEASAIGSLRTISTVQAQMIAQSQFPDPASGTPLYTSFAQLVSLSPPPLDSALTGGEHIKSGYKFSTDLVTLSPGDPDYTAYTIIVRSGTDLKNLLIDPIGVTHYTNDGAIPSMASPALQ